MKLTGSILVLIAVFSTASVMPVAGTAATIDAPRYQPADGVVAPSGRIRPSPATMRRVAPALAVSRLASPSLQPAMHPFPSTKSVRGVVPPLRFFGSGSPVLAAKFQPASAPAGAVAVGRTPYPAAHAPVAFNRFVFRRAEPAVAAAPAAPSPPR